MPCIGSSSRPPFPVYQSVFVEGKGYHQKQKQMASDGKTPQVLSHAVLGGLGARTKEYINHHVFLLFFPGAGDSVGGGFHS